MTTRTQPQTHISRWLPSIAMFVLAIVLWETAVRALKIGVFLLPAPSAIVARFAADAGQLFAIGTYTFQSALAGFVIGVLLGVGVAALAV
ncbi:MAG TPA: hypothetical protein VFT99_24510, partial [Roseiflexaceae bacterium]|nr:hypothetical protein [Roseiflexaceae bacterium]